MAATSRLKTPHATSPSRRAVMLDLIRLGSIALSGRLKQKFAHFASDRSTIRRRAVKLSAQVDKISGEDIPVTFAVSIGI